MKILSNDYGIGCVFALFLFILGMAVLTFALIYVVGPLMFIGVCLLVATAFILWKQKGKIPAFSVKQPFWLLLLLGLLLIGLSSLGLEMVSPEFENLRQFALNIFGG